MYIKKIKLKNFRNLKEVELSFNKNINIFYGFNAQGKTNLLESIYLSGIGRSFRTNFEKEIISFDEKNCYIQTYIDKNGVSNKISIGLSYNKNKSILLNGIQIKKLGELLGVLLIISFTPDDLQLIKSGPSERRHFIDMELCQLSNRYYYELKQYNHVLKQRNILLKKIKYNSSLEDTIFIWNEKLVEHGSKIIKYREKFVKQLNEIAHTIHLSLTNKAENLLITYKKNVSEDVFLKKLEQNYEKDLQYGTTSYGIHKDDLNFFINDKEVKIFGSQGQQRTVSLSTKLAEIKLIEKEKNEKPVLLLDDVLSELDKNRQKYLLDSIKNMQTIITCTGVEDVLSNIDILDDENITIFNVNNGNIK